VWQLALLAERRGWTFVIAARPERQRQNQSEVEQPTDDGPAMLVTEQPSRDLARDKLIDDQGFRSLSAILKKL
jgi:hypothetical protein